MGFWDYNLVKKYKTPFESVDIAQNICSTIFRNDENHFSRATKPIFILMTVLGLQPYKQIDSKIDKSSTTKDGGSLRKFANKYITLGFIFWLPLPFLGGRVTYLSIKAFVGIMQKYGFFNSATVTIMQSWLLVQNGWTFAVYTFIFASKFIAMIEKLDGIELSPRALKHYRSRTYRMLAILLVTIVGYGSVKAAATINNINDLGENYHIRAMFAFDLFTLFYFSLLCFIGPTAWMSVTSFFIVQAFRVIRDQLKAAVEKQNTDSANIRLIFFDYLRLTEIVEVADSVFAPIVLMSVSSYVILLCTSILNITALSDHFGFALAYTVIILDALLTICLCSIYLNDAARAIQNDLHRYVPETFEVKVLIEKFDRKSSDGGWGFTIGKLVLLDKSTFVALLGAMITFIALWSQFSDAQTARQSSNTTSVANIIDELDSYF